jgi:hypothetical protein
MLGRSWNGSLGHEHYSSSPSKTLRAAMGCSVRATEMHNATKRGSFACWRCVSQAGALKSPAGFYLRRSCRGSKKIIGLVGTVRDLELTHPSARTPAGRSPPVALHSREFRCNGRGPVRAGAVAWSYCSGSLGLFSNIVSQIRPARSHAGDPAESQ